MNDRTIRVLPDKKKNRLAIHDAGTGELLHLFYPEKTLSELTPKQMTEHEAEALRDFMVNGRHEAEDENEPGW